MITLQDLKRIESTQDPLIKVTNYLLGVPQLPKPIHPQAHIYAHIPTTHPHHVIRWKKMVSSSLLQNQLHEVAECIMHSAHQSSNSTQDMHKGPVTLLTKSKSPVMKLNSKENLKI